MDKYFSVRIFFFLFIEITNIPRNDDDDDDRHDTIEARFRAGHDLRKVDYEPNQNTNENTEQQVQYSTRSTDVLLQSRITASTQDDLISTSIKTPTEQQSEPSSLSDIVENIPSSNDQFDSKRIPDQKFSEKTQIDPQAVDTSQENHSDDDALLKQTLTSTPSYQEAHTPLTSGTQQSISNTVGNSSSFDSESDRHLQAPLKPLELTISDTSTAQIESHTSVQTSSPVQYLEATKLYKNVHIHPRHVQINQDDISTAGKIHIRCNFFHFLLFEKYK